MSDVESTSAAVERNEQLALDDLDILFNISGTPTDPYEVVFDLYDYTTGTEVLINPADRTPNKIDTGHYYAPWYVPVAANLGEYHIHWKYRMLAGDPQSIDTDDFFVVAQTGQKPNMTEAEENLVMQLRYMLRDNNPDKYAHFRPPEHADAIGAYNATYQYLWDDQSLLYCLTWATCDMSNVPPRRTTFTIENIYSGDTRTQCVTPMVLLRAACYAIDMMAAHWTSEGFNYSINGVSLDLDKANDYRSLKDTFWNQYTEGLEEYKKGVKIAKGLRHSYYKVGPGRNASAVLGPYTSGQHCLNWVRQQGVV